MTHAFRRDEKAGKGLENITAKLAGNHDGKRDFKTRLVDDQKDGGYGSGEAGARIGGGEVGFVQQHFASTHVDPEFIITELLAPL